MSGICGIWQRDGSGEAEGVTRLVSAALTLDAAETVASEAVGSTGVGVSARFTGQQVYRNRHVLVACDAELYAGSDGCPPVEVEGVRGSCATGAYLADAYERLGVDLLETLRGHFSFVIWDERLRMMLAAVDRFAVNPLVYYEDPSCVLVASRIEGLLACPQVPRDINPRAIGQYLHYTVNPGPGTIFSKIKRLLPGTFLVARTGEAKATRYWDMRYRDNGRADETKLSRELEASVAESVRAHCKQDDFTRIGAFLSGGTDSSTVVGMMSRLRRGPVHTFSIGFEEQRFNELEYARITARKFQAKHHEYLVNGDDCVSALPDMIRYFDEPFGNSSAIPTYFCARLAAQNGVGVLLAGDGGDELFGGNERYRTDKIFEIYQRAPRVLRKGLVEPALQAIPIRNGIFGRARRYVRRSNLPQPCRFFSYNLLSEHSPNTIFEPGFQDLLGDYLEIPAAYYRHGPAHDPLDRLLYVDVKMTLSDNDLLKVTRMAELAGVRPRFPFLDRSVAEFSGRVPARLKVKGFDKRYLFKRAFRELLPIEVIQKKKHGFGIPVAYWMRTHPRMRELTRDVLLSAKTRQRGYIRPSFTEELLHRHETDETTYYGDTLWTLLALELWFRRFADEPRKGSS